MILKVLIVSLLVFMVYNLFRALVIMNSKDPNKPSMSKFIGRRVMTSVLLVALLLIAMLTGVITPNPRPF